MAVRSRGSARLWVGSDVEKLAVATLPLPMRSGRARRRQRGVVTELMPVPPTGTTRRMRVWSTVRLSAALTVLTIVLAALGLPWWWPAAGSAAIVWYVVRLQARAAAEGLFAVPVSPADPPTSYVLHAQADRLTFVGCLATAERVQRTWPALPRMIDPADAAQLLARALWDLAGMLARRQEIRQLRDELAAVSYAGLPADTPAVVELLGQRDRVQELWRDVNAEVRQHAERLLATAVAGEDMIREQQIGSTARHAQQAIARLTATGPPARLAAAQDLADRTAAVVGAYRDLTARYGPR